MTHHEESRVEPALVPSCPRVWPGCASSSGEDSTGVGHGQFRGGCPICLLGHLRRHKNTFKTSAPFWHFRGRKSAFREALVRAYSWNSGGEHYLFANFGLFGGDFSANLGLLSPLLMEIPLEKARQGRCQMVEPEL